MEKSTPRIIYSGIDIGKFLCAFLILLYHFFSEYGSLPRILDDILSLYAVAVALFMAMSGFILFNKIKTLDSKTERWRIVKKQFIRIYEIYLLWSIPYLLFNISQWKWGEISASFVFWQIQRWVFKSTFYTIWFMPMLAFGLLFSFWVTEYLPHKCVIVLTIMMYAIGSLTLTYKFIGDRIPSFSSFCVFTDQWLGGSRGWLFYAFPLIMVGRRIAYCKKERKADVVFCQAVLCLIILLVEALVLRRLSGKNTGIDMTLLMPITVYCLLIFLISIKIPVGTYNIWMRNISTIVFMSQRIFLSVLPSIYSKISEWLITNQYTGAFILVLLEFSISSLIICLSYKISVLKRLY